MMEPTSILPPSVCVSPAAEADFVAVALGCEQLSASALEMEDMSAQRVVYRELNSLLSRLLPVLNEPIPQSCQTHFIVDKLPDTPPALESDGDLLCEYCLALSELLAGGKMSLAIEENLQGLLAELTRFLSDTIAAPRWLRTPGGLTPII